MRAAGLVFATLSVALAGCGQSTLEPPSSDGAPTYIRWVSPAHPYATATQVRLTIENDYAWVDKKLVEHRHAVRVLSPQERQAFEHAVRRVRLVGFVPKTRAEAIGPACFVPHHYFRYYDAQGKQIGQLAVCFCCLGAQAEPRLAFEGGDADSLRVNIPAVKSFVRSLGLPTDVACSPDEMENLNRL